jgi:GNAT superfamily N-acetyltransferase
MTPPLLCASGALDALHCRLMVPGDIEQVMAIQHACYASAFHEPAQAFTSKLRASPLSCWVLSISAQVRGYLVCLPIEGDQLPPLHAKQWSAPARANWLYLHDMAIAPDARGAGAARQLLDLAIDFARSHQLADIGLIAVQDSQPYWSKRGFVPALPGERVSSTKLATFGPHALFMQRQTPGTS